MTLPRFLQRSIRLIIKRLPPSPYRLFLGRSLFREDFVDLIGSNGYRVRKAAEPHTDTAIGPYIGHAPGEADAVAFGNLISHSEYLEREGARAR